MKFQLEARLRSDKKVIAKKPLKNLYEMNSGLCLHLSEIFSQFDVDS